MKVLVIGSNNVLRNAVNKVLGEAGYECTLIRIWRSGRDLALASTFGAIVLDLTAPGVDGIESLRSMRREGVQTPILILNARGSVDDRVVELHNGVEEYPVTPSAFPEVTARLDSLRRRSASGLQSLLTIGSLKLDLATRRVTRNEQDLDLTSTECSVLEYLMRHHGQVVTRKMLCEYLWGADWNGLTDVIEPHINRLRNKVDGNLEPKLIRTLRGRGYVLPTN